jgi:hypothetical protein
MWLDGLIGALGTLAAGVGFMLGPQVHSTGGRIPAQLLDLAWPAWICC